MKEKTEGDEYRGLRIEAGRVVSGEQAVELNQILSVRYGVECLSGSVIGERSFLWQLGLVVFLIAPAGWLVWTGAVGWAFLLILSAGAGLWLNDRTGSEAHLNRLICYRIYLGLKSGEIVLASWKQDGDYLRQGQEKNQCRKIVARIERERKADEERVETGAFGELETVNRAGSIGNGARV